MGHVYIANRYGIKASAPMFIPGFGAFIRLQQHLTDVRQDARMGLAGPIWGTGAALAFLAGSLALESPILAAIAQIGAFINLFNLIPLGPLDGGRAFRALSRSQRWLAAAALGSAWAVTEQPLLVILILAAAYRALCERGPAEGDRGALFQYAVLVGVLSALMLIPVAL
jgi:Zn-dependent protease